MENITHNFVVVGVDTSTFPPRQFSTAFWEVATVADAVAVAVAAAYEALGNGELEIRIIPITA